MRNHTTLSGDAAEPVNDVAHTKRRREMMRSQALAALVGNDRVLYAIRLSDGVIKIGCTANILSRRRQFGVGTEIVALRPGDFAEEAEIHAELREHLARGREFYNPTPEVLAVVNDLRQHFNLPPLAA